MIVPELAEIVGQPGEAPDTHAKRQIRPLDMRGAGAIEIGIPGIAVTWMSVISAGLSRASPSTGGPLSGMMHGERLNLR